MNNLTKPLLLLVFMLTLTCFLAVKQCNKNGDIITDRDNLTKYLKDSITKTVSKDGKVIATIPQLTIDRNTALEQVAGLKEELANMNIKPSQAKQVVTEYDRIADSLTLAAYFERHYNGIYSKLDTLPIPCDFKPFPVRDSDKYHLVTGVVSKKNIKLKYSAFDSTFLVFNTTGGLFKKTRTKVSILHTNPNVIVTDIRDYNFVEKKKWFQTTVAKVVAGGVLAIVGEHELQTLNTK